MGMAVGPRMAAEAFDQTVLSQVGLVRRIGLSNLHDQEELDDYIQQVILYVYAEREDLRDIALLPRRIAAIAQKTAQKWNRQRRPLLTDTCVDIPLPGPSIQERLEERERWSALVDALKRLDKDDRELLGSYYLEERWHDELRMRYGLSYGAVRVRLTRARQALRRQVAALSALFGFLERPRPPRKFGEVPLGSKRPATSISFSASTLLIGGLVIGGYTAEQQFLELVQTPLAVERLIPM